jgi:hypothetical protein
MPTRFSGPARCGGWRYAWIEVRNRALSTPDLRWPGHVHGFQRSTTTPIAAAAITYSPPSARLPSAALMGERSHEHRIATRSRDDVLAEDHLQIHGPRRSRRAQRFMTPPIEMHQPNAHHDTAALIRSSNTVGHHAPASEARARGSFDFDSRRHRTRTHGCVMDRNAAGQSDGKVVRSGTSVFLRSPTTSIASCRSSLRRSHVRTRSSSPFEQPTQ